jgi:hypothetical protein
MKVIPVKPRQTPLARYVPPALKTGKHLLEQSVIRVPHSVLRNQIYYEIEILPQSYLDGTEKFVIPVDEPLLLAFLTSSLFAIWVKGMGKKETITITSTTMYNNFPFPDLTNKQSGEIERAVNYVFEARAECRFVKLLDVYQPESMPNFLVKAHENLDRVLYDIMGIPENATSEQVLDSLHSKYLEMLNT